MKKLMAASLFTLSLIAGENHAHWGYSGDTSPEHWGDLSEKFFICKKGVNQSPVNLNRFIDAKLDPLKVQYSTNAKSVVNNGHTIEVKADGKNSVTVDGIKFNLLQFHFHTPSENQIKGKSFPMEAHFVHKSKEGEYLVVALMFNEGEKNKNLQKMLDSLNPKEGNESEIKKSFKPNELFPKDLSYFRYSGSFTTPPCTEGVRWIVLKTPVTASKEQIEQMHKIMGKNNRPVQPLKARVILK